MIGEIIRKRLERLDNERPFPSGELMPNHGSLGKNQHSGHSRLRTWLADGAQSIRNGDKS